MLLYRVGDCVMHLCPICNRRTRNVLDDDVDEDDDDNETRSSACCKQCQTVQSLT